MDRLTKRIGDNIIDVSSEYFNLTHDELVHKLFRRLAYYEDLEEQGLLIKLPCKEGDMVYKEIVQHDNYDDSEYKIISTVCFRLDMLKSVGKTVFLTRDEAELKLKECE